MPEQKKRTGGSEGKRRRGIIPAAVMLCAVLVLGVCLLLRPAARPLEGVKVFLAGDSRSSTDYSFYGELLEEKSGCTALVQGASGRDAAYNASDAYFERIAANPHDFSIWLVGGNDDGRAGSVGTFDPDSPLAAAGESVVAETDIAQDFSGGTLIQAVDHIMRKYRAMFSENDASNPPVMIFCTDLPQQRENAESEWSRPENWERKRMAVLECCEKNGIPCLDLYALCAFDMTREPMYVPPTDTENSRGVFFMDGLHPNRKGMERITDLEIAEMIRMRNPR